jgi:outer membrane protein OmpA-like peptidoglycan-associated protein
MSSFKRWITGLFSLILIFHIHGIHGQELFKIEKLPPAINSQYEEIKPFISAAGDSLFFIRSYSPENRGGDYAGEDIWLSVFEEGVGWNRANNTFGYRNQPGPDILIGESVDGKFLFTLQYLTSGQDRIIKIHQNKIHARDSTDRKTSEPFGEIKVGNDYHDLYLNPEGTILLISMTGLNTLGLEDLYVSLKSEDGSWSNPTHLGPKVNSRGFEISPFLSRDQRTLYFASNGHPGMGDADIFYCKRLDDGWGNWSEPINMGSPFNSPRFDAYLCFNREKEYYFSSNRDGTYSDIFRVTGREAQSTELNGIEKSMDELSDLRYGPDSQTEQSEMIKLSLFFDFDEFTLRKEELDKLEGFIRDSKISSDNQLEIKGYTDDVGSESYNKKLSEKRARFVYKYLRKSGIGKDRMTMEGKGIWISYEGPELMPEKKRKVDIREVSPSE